MAGYVWVLVFRTALFCDLSGLGAVAGAFSSLGDVCCLLVGAGSVLFLTVGGTVIDGSEDGLGGSGGGAGTLGI